MLREVMYFEDVVYRVDSLVVFRKVKEDSIIKMLREMAAIISYDPDLRGITLMYYDFIAALSEKAEELGLTGNIFKKYAIYLFLNDVNEFSVACEKKMNVANTSLYNLVLRDMGSLQFFMEFDLKNLCDNVGYGEKMYDYKPLVVGENSFYDQIESAETASKIADELMWYYRALGAGDLAVYKMYKYDSEQGLVGIRSADATVMSDLIGCSYQKELIQNNTNAFVSGNTANNVLLVGARGTGKSSCVKAVANEYFDQGVRLIDFSKEQLSELPKLLKILEKRGKYFIVYLDDLSYNEAELQYKYLKSILEGSVEVCPKNVLFYATSNRRHVVQEKWADRHENISDVEVHATDTVNEKLSLADRFGVVVTFPQPTQDEYISIVLGIAQKRGLSISEEFLKDQAIKWALNAKSLSGRTARQFINHIYWELKKG